MSSIPSNQDFLNAAYTQLGVSAGSAVRSHTQNGVSVTRESRMETARFIDWAEARENRRTRPMFRLATIGGVR